MNTQEKTEVGIILMENWDLKMEVCQLQNELEAYKEKVDQLINDKEYRS
tara:strand:- start:61 stop:207 length:147 start_codon:yes stop_codon:yes gene_type:complete